jgi:hypothetical protein
MSGFLCHPHPFHFLTVALGAGAVEMWGRGPCGRPLRQATTRVPTRFPAPLQKTSLCMLSARAL